MAKIVYGVSGEGSGHSSRAREMITHLQDLGHIVKVVSYDRGYNNLKADFDVFETEGLHITSLDNRVSKVKTFTDNSRIICNDCLMDIANCRLCAKRYLSLLSLIVSLLILSR
jgi:uncharacterized protein (TIGR00661 family)